MPSPPIPEVPKDSPSGLYKLFSSIKESLEIGLGRRGNVREKFVTRGDLSDLGVIESATSTSVSGLGNAAFKNVGTGAGTVAAGDHLHTLSHISDAGVLAAGDDASDVPYPSSHIIGTPTDPTDLEHLLGHVWSAGAVHGFSLTDNGDGTIATASGTAALRSTTDEHGHLVICEVAADASVTLTDNATNYVYLDYNAGAPVVTSSTSVTDFNCLDKCIIYTVAREGTTLYWVDARSQNVDFNRKHRRLLLECDTFRHVLGGCIISETGTRNIAVTAGAFYYGLAKIEHTAFDTSVTDTFIYYYRDGVGGWTKATGQTQIDNTQYDDGTGVLATLSNNKFGVHWVYLILDNPTVLAVQYGQGDYANVAAAEAATVPTPPPSLQGVGTIIGRIIIEKNAAAFDNTDSAFTQSFVASAATQHNGLAGIQGGITNEYYHFTDAEHTDLTDAGDSALHYHATDRDLANATGTLGGAVALTLPSTIVVSSASAALSITQTGAGDALVVNDVAGDGTPFVIRGNGNVIVGYTTGTTVGPTSVANIQLHGSGNPSQIGISQWLSTSSQGPRLVFSKSRSDSIGAYVIAQDGDVLGEIMFYGDDGTDISTEGARIAAYVDGTPGANDMPTRIAFWTTPDGSSAPAEAMRIDSSQVTTHKAKFGYGLSGSGGTVTQITSKSTGVTLNKPSGQITMHNAALAASTTVVFTLTNSTIEANDTILVHRASAGTAGSYVVGCDSVAAGSCVIYVRNTSAGSLSEAVVLQFSAIKSAIA